MELGEADDGELSDSDADTQTEDVQSRTITGDGLPDDNIRAAVLEDAVVERGLLDRLKQAASKLDRSDVPHELSETVDRPDFQDPGEKPERVPDRYSTPLERPDGTRTPLFDGVPVREQTKQGVLGDCGIIATLGAVAGHRPDAIRECVREGNDGNYQVCLHEAKYSMSRMRYEPTGRTINLVVTPELPIHDDEPERPSLADAGGVGAAWAPVLEKAIAGVDQTWSDGRREKWGERWKVQGGGRDLPTGYVRLNQGSNPSDRAELLTQLTGSPARTFELPTGYDLNGRSADRQLKYSGVVVSVTEIHLGQGRQRNTSLGSFGVVYVNPGKDGDPPEVLLSVDTDDEQDFKLRPGDTFPVRDQTWKLDRVETSSGSDWTVVLTRVE
ncbi:DUF6406 domain-containing protein [Actinoallomurus sp. CA-142502]|uniref:DUF6406 domain-containing protein n=1 Tax=Actinoallomurus sp. CA-142502 TaxID=3239885 RepID=UPI003D8BF250